MSKQHPGICRPLLPVKADAAPMPNGHRVRPVVAAKALIGLGALGFLLWLARPSEVARQLAGAHVGAVCLGLIVVALTVPFAGLRWWMIARTVGMRLSLRFALRLTLIGIFFGQLLPSAVGGDIVRGWIAFKEGHGIYPTTTSIVLDRIVALIAALILLIVGLPILAGFARPEMVANLALLALAMLIGLVTLSISDILVPQRYWPRAATAVRQVLRDGRRRLVSTTGVCVIALSLVIHLMTIGAVELFAHAIGVGVHYLQFLTVVPAAVIAAMVPVSINGWGVREGVMVTGLALFGVSPDQALIPSMLVGISAMIMALPGGWLWFTLKQ